MSAQPEEKTLAQWQQLHCQHIGPDGLWSEELIHSQLKAFPAWQYSALPDRPGALARHCKFANFAAVEPVVKALMALAREQDHHPQVQFGYNTLSVEFSTHSAGGISNNDWICAALLEAALEPFTV